MHIDAIMYNDNESRLSRRPTLDGGILFYKILVQIHALHTTAGFYNSLNGNTGVTLLRAEERTQFEPAVDFSLFSDLTLPLRSHNV